MTDHMSSPRWRRAIQPVAYEDRLARIGRLQAESQARRIECTALAKGVFVSRSQPAPDPSRLPLWLRAIVVLSLLAAAHRLGGQHSGEVGRNACSRPSKVALGVMFLRTAWCLRGLTRSIQTLLEAWNNYVSLHLDRKIKKPPQSTR